MVHVFKHESMSTVKFTILIILNAHINLWPQVLKKSSRNYNVLYFLSTRFEYLKACGTTLIVPNVAPGFQWNGERIRLLSHHSCLYIRSLYPLLNKVVCISLDLQHQPIKS